MKSLVIFACFLALAYGITPAAIEKIKERVNAFGKECKTEVGTTDDDVAPILAHKAPETKNGKCFVACMNKKMGFQDKSGKIDKDGSYAAIEKMKPVDADMYEKMKKIADACLAEVTDAADECETAAAMFSCVQKQKKALGIMQIDFRF